MTTFASFSYPKFLGDLRSKPLAERLEQFKRTGKLNTLLGYRKDAPDINPTGKMFYLESDFMPRLRWVWCDQIYSGIRHTGWFTNDDCAGDKIRGLVMQLPHERGWLAGWSMGEGMASLVEYELYGDKYTAARRADKMAELAAERERESEATYEQKLIAEQEAMIAERDAKCPTCKPSITMADILHASIDYCDACRALLCA